MRTIDALHGEKTRSAIALSMHKAGSSIFDVVLMQFFTRMGITLDRISPQVMSSPLKEDEVFLNYQDKIKSHGFYYGVARGPYVKDMTVLPNLRLLIQVRDPRDCITSAYYSFKKSHVLPTDPAKQAAFLERRKKLEAMDIDQYALSQSGSYRDRMNILRNITTGHDDFLLVTYEDMVERTEDWFDKIADFTGQPIDDELRNALDSKVDFTVKHEDESQHKRQVLPGDHKRKLRPETIARMTEIMGEPMRFFGYV